MNPTLARASALLDDAILAHTGQPPAAPGRGLPVGVYRRGPSRLEVQLSINGQARYLGSASTPEQAAKLVTAVRKVAPKVIRCKPVRPA